MLRSARAARAAMRFCDADACSSCALVEDECACLRHKAQFCIWLAARTSNCSLRAAFGRLSSYLIEEADALGKEKAIIARQSLTRSFMKHSDLGIDVKINQIMGRSQPIATDWARLI
jgi:hypothetical protein